MMALCTPVVLAYLMNAILPVVSSILLVMLLGYGLSKKRLVDGTRFLARYFKVILLGVIPGVDHVRTLANATIDSCLARAFVGTIFYRGAGVGS